MNKIYFGIPLALLLAFGIYNLQVRDEFAQRALVKKTAEALARQHKVDEEKHNRDLAIEEAKRISEQNRQRKEAERIRKEAEDAQRSKERQDLDTAKTDSGRLKDEIRDLQVDLDRERKGIEAANLQKQSYDTEKAFLQKYIEVVRNNSKRFEGLVAKIDESEKAKAEAAVRAKSGK